MHVGYVVYDLDSNTVLKLKTPYYLTSKFIARTKRLESIFSGNYKQNFDEEYYPLVDAIRENIVEYTAMDEQARLAWVRNFVEA